MQESLPSDGRSLFEWKTRYVVDERNPKNPFREIKCEALYLFVLLVIGFASIILNYKGVFVYIFGIEPEDVNAAIRIGYCLCAGLIGGVTFSIKIFYRAVARGQWNYDRKYWRIFSPVISLSVTSVVAVFMIDDIVAAHVYWTYTIGYFAGYFSENAVGKMYDIAVVLFSTPTKEQSGSESRENNSNS